MPKEIKTNRQHHKIQADKVFLVAILPFLCFILFLVHEKDRKEISGLADETTAFLESVCERYDGYAVGHHVGALKDIRDKARALAEFSTTEIITDEEFLQNYIKTQDLDGILVLDEEQNLVAEAGNREDNGNHLWESFLQNKNIRNILQYPQKTFSGNVEQEGVSYEVVAVARKDQPGILLCYVDATEEGTDLYTASIDKTLQNNTFHKNPEIVITDGKTIVATNTSMKQGASIAKVSLLKNITTKTWKEGRLVRLTWQGNFWYGKRSVYKNYFIYVFYSTGEVFSDIPFAVAAVAAAYVFLCLILMLFRRHGEKKHWEQEQKQIRTIQAVSSLYDAFCILHLQEMKLEEIRSTERLRNILKETHQAGIVLEKVIGQIIAPQDRERYQKFFDRETIEERMRGQTNINEIFRDINGVWFAEYLIPVEYGKDGTLKNILIVNRNINDYKQKEEIYREQLRKTARDAQIANEAKTLFLRRMSHDVRTPINGIRGMAVVAEQSLNQPERMRECVGKIITSLDYLQDLFDDVLRMSKLESGTLSFEEKPFGLRKVLQDTADFIEERAKEENLTFSFTVENLIHDRVMGSPLHLRQVLQNVMSNAVKFNRPGGSVTVVCREMKCQNETMWLEIICKDTGIGISPAFQERVFEPFAQEEESSARTNYRGTGLGLPVAKEILEQRGGTISLESEQGKGSTVTMQMPFKLDTSPQEKTAEKASLEGIRILLVEDNELNMEVARCLLEEKQADITMAYNGKEAVEQFAASEEGNFDVILMDIMMPEMDGLTAARTIRQMTRGDAKSISILAMSANSFVEDKERSLAAGMNAHLSKPLKIEKVTAAIWQYVKK